MACPQGHLARQRPLPVRSAAPPLPPPPLWRLPPAKRSVSSHGSRRLPPRRPPSLTPPPGRYGLVETRLKAPKGYGPWPAAWLNGCYGFISESSQEFLLQEDYPFLCGQFWPPELDFFEHFSPEHTW